MDVFMGINIKFIEFMLMIKREYLIKMRFLISSWKG